MYTTMAVNVHRKDILILLVFLACISFSVTEAKKRFVAEFDFEQALNDLKAEFEAFKANAGSTFIRWGKNDCTSGSELVYRGYIAGKAYGETGGSSDSLCLPADPSWANYTSGHGTLRASLYGTEIDLHDDLKIFGKPVFQEDLPCAVCRAQYTTTIMVPARTACYPGWRLQYTGYLVSNWEAHKASYDMICLDGDPDFVPGGGTNDDQHVVYVTEVHCGSLPCPPYVENREVACSVCSK